MLTSILFIAIAVEYYFLVLHLQPIIYWIHALIYLERKQTLIVI